MSSPKFDPFSRLREALAARYRIDRQLGRGGMGIVYLAHELALNRHVALKLLPPELANDPNRRARFLREARTAARLQHANIVPIYAVDQVDEFVFYTMAYIDGETLAQRVARDGPLPSAEASRILSKVARAVGYAHAQGIIHRDLKAENILLEKGTGRPMVTDFGIAYVKDEPPIAGDHKVMGTFHYMSPEQATGSRLDERSDVYALGVVAFFAASGVLPFPGQTPAEIVERHLNEYAPPLVTRDGDFNAPLVRAVDRCLEKHPDDRFQNAGELAAFLEEPEHVHAALRSVSARLRYTSGLTIVTVVGSVIFLDAARAGDRTLARIALLAVVATIVASAAYVLPLVRRVLKAGYDRDMIVRAVTADAKLRRAELAFQYGDGPGKVELGARKAFVAGLFATGFGVWLGFADAIDPLLAAALAGGAGLLTLIGGSVAARLYYRRQDKTGEHWLWFWKGPLGYWTAKLAGLGLKGRRHRLPSAQRAESAIFEAAQHLFEQLPNAAQSALERLPGVLRQLELETQGLRTRLSEPEAPLAGDREAPAPPQEARQKAEQRLSEAVTAVEDLRIELERLRDGAGTVKEASAKLSAAERIPQDLDGLLPERNP